MRKRGCWFLVLKGIYFEVWTAKMRPETFRYECASLSLLHLGQAELWYLILVFGPKQSLIVLCGFRMNLGYLYSWFVLKKTYKNYTTKLYVDDSTIFNKGLFWKDSQTWDFQPIGQWLMYILARADFANTILRWKSQNISA